MAQNHVIIGAGFGDEGKGNITDCVVNSFPDKLRMVIRYNGGAQAGHTVVLPREVNKIKRHVFSHLGCGTLSNVPTYLGPRFVVLPKMFLKEYEELKAFDPQVYIDGDCQITTPYDIAINQFVEKARAKAHGSCGIGFNETIHRGLTEIRINVSDLYQSDTYLELKLNTIKESYVLKRRNELKLSDLPNFDRNGFEKIIYNENIIPNFLKELREFADKIYICGSNILKTVDVRIFEGAQGLLLDEDNEKYFPHVTRSKPGMKYVFDILKSVSSREYIDKVHYVSRIYRTRHGNGPMSHEVPLKINNPEETNITNEYQGHFRYGVLDLDELLESIANDRSTNGFPEYCIDITCTDQVEKVDFIMNNKRYTLPKEVFYKMALEAFDINYIHITDRPDRHGFKHVTEDHGQESIFPNDELQHEGPL